MAIFLLTNKTKYKHAYCLCTYHWKTTTKESNACHIRSFVPNVSSQLYTFSCFYLLENKLYRVKKVLFSSLLCSKRFFLLSSVNTIDRLACFSHQAKSFSKFFRAPGNMTLWWIFNCERIAQVYAMRPQYGCRIELLKTWRPLNVYLCGLKPALAVI